jgi:diphosphomevalonate decarboxylase
MKQATARAGANIALVKYWGKRDRRLNLPAAGSISITLSDLETRTTIRPDESLDDDVLVLDGVEQPAGRIAATLDHMRTLGGQTTRCRVESRNNFPTGAGLASSASGFAALVVAADAAFGLGLPERKLSELARLGSGSAARSIFGGFVEMAAGTFDDGSDAVARPLLPAGDWPLEVVVAITDTGGKAVGSRDGMNRTMETSPYYAAWVESVPPDLERARAAIAARDFEGLGRVAEHSALKMHASMLAAEPGLVYWKPATLTCIERVRELRQSGRALFFTIDAGPQVKVICPAGEGAAVAAEIRALAGVREVMVSGLGEGARVVAS